MLHPSQPSQQSESPAARRFDLDAESTRKFPAGYVDRAALEALRATLPPVPPMRRSSPPMPISERRDTPHTIVLAKAARADRATLTVLAGGGAGASFALDHPETLL